MTIVGGFDVHRKQLTFDYVDTETGEVGSGQIRPGTRMPSTASASRSFVLASAAGAPPMTPDHGQPPQTPTGDE